MKNWIETRLRKPPQGKKVLCFDKGDLSVRQRFKDYWFPIPYVDSEYADINPPELWQEIEFPKGFTGFLKLVALDGKNYTVDEFEKNYPEDFNDLVEDMVEVFKASRINEN